MRDLELRGSGNLLGERQSGHIAGIGFDLYCQLLRQSIGRLKGEKQASSIRANVRLDFIVVGESAARAASETPMGFSAIKAAEQASRKGPEEEAYIPHDYIAETRLRIDIYRQLAMATSLAEVQSIQKSMEDRFGELPLSVHILVALSHIRCLAESKGVSSVETEANRLKCRLALPGSPFYQVGNHFPRLTASNPLLKLKEIIRFLEIMEEPKK